MAPTDWFSTIVCPLFGMILANIMWCSPMKAVLQARETRSIGSLNSIPFVATITNCIGWMLYGCLKKDAFLFFANVFGIVLGMFYTINCLTLTTKKPEEASFSKDYLITESLLLFSVFFWCLMGLFCAMLFNSFNDPVAQAANLVGYVSVTFSISYYAAPLSTVFQVIATHDASSLYLPTISINFINGCCWFFYGLIGTHDIILWGPNGLGILLSCFQISLIIMFRKQSIASLFSLRGDEQQQLISKKISLRMDSKVMTCSRSQAK